ncbi:MAG TPA: POTRA domain-containing protein, partial [Hymenobacter sp.]
QQGSLPAFSFGKFIFLSPAHEELSSTERLLLLRHEQVHVAQRHSLDLLFCEAAGVLLWFNPVLGYLKRQLKNTHEYLADEVMAAATPSLSSYGQLLIKLAAHQPPFALLHTFSTSTKQIFQRIAMLTQPHSRPVQKLRFLFVVPLLVLVWVATACVGGSDPEAPVKATTSSVAGTAHIGQIRWQGNTAVSTTQLNQALGLKTGDVYDSTDVAERLNYRPNAADVTSLYMDKGYLFFNLTPLAKPQPDGSIDLTFTLSEGRPAHIGAITVTGNKTVPTKDLLKLIPLKQGDLFNRAKLIQAQKNLTLQGSFNPEKVGVNPRPIPQPNEAADLVDITFTLVEKSQQPR